MKEDDAAPSPGAARLSEGRRVGSRWRAEGSLHRMDHISLILLESELEFGRGTR